MSAQPTTAITAAPLFHPEPRKLTLVIRSFDKEGNKLGPKTKKNSPQLIPHMHHPILVPSEAYRKWHRGAARDLKPALANVGDKIPIGYPVNLCALVYREARVGDLGGYLAGLCDFLEDIGVLVDDKWVAGFDGSRLLKCPDDPRIELILEELR